MSEKSADIAKQRLPRAIWVLGLVSLLMDMSSELVHGLLPVFLAGTLGVSALAIGLLEGAAEATAQIVKFFSGALSDHWRKRKPLVLLGYGLAALTKPLFPLAHGIGTVVAARMLDRVGKGLRGAPRDALVADLAPAELRGAAFGLRQALDTVGAFAGPLLAFVVLALAWMDVRTVLWLAVVPAFAALLLLWLGVHEPEPRADSAPTKRASFAAEAWRGLGGTFWRVMLVAGLVALARCSEAFLILRASDLGLPVPGAPLVLVLMNAVYMLAAYPAGRLADRWPRRRVLAMGMVLLMAGDVLLALASNGWVAAVGIALWGAHYACTQAVLSAAVADAAPPSLRGTAFGAFNLVSGLGLLIASGLTGWLWDGYGAATAFWVGAALAALAAGVAIAAPLARTDVTKM
jgi:MFS family permease